MHNSQIIENSQACVVRRTLSGTIGRLVFTYEEVDSATPNDESKKTHLASTNSRKKPWAVHVCVVPTAHSLPLSLGKGHVESAIQKEDMKSITLALIMRR